MICNLISSIQLITLFFYYWTFNSFLIISLQIRDLEAEYELEQRRAREAMANARKHERQYKELQALMEDDKRQIAELTGLTDSLNIKIKTYRRQIDEAVSSMEHRHVNLAEFS